MPARERLTPTEQTLAYLIGLGILLALTALFLSSLGTVEDDNLTTSMLLVGLAVIVLGVGAWLILARPWETFDDLQTPYYVGHDHDAPPQESAAEVALGDAVPGADELPAAEEPGAVILITPSQEIVLPDAQPAPADEFPAGPDDLTLIEGIGPKTAEALNRVGITAWQQIAEMSPEQLDETVRAQGVRLVGKTDTWPLQAKLAAGGNLTALEDFKKRIKQGIPHDDLTPIEGIGLRAQAALYQAGIYTFDELAETSPEALRTALHAAGLTMLNPATWPEQAALIARGDLNAFEAMKKRLGSE